MEIAAARRVRAVRKVETGFLSEPRDQSTHHDSMNAVRNVSRNFQRKRVYGPPSGRRIAASKKCTAGTPGTHAAPMKLAGRNGSDQRKARIFGDQHAGDFAELRFD